MKSLADEYIKYCDLKKSFHTNNIINLQEESFLFPTTLLPLCSLLLKNHDRIIYPRNQNLTNYISTIMYAGTPQTTKSYIPAIRLPTNPAEYYNFNSLIDGFLREYDNICSEQNPFIYVVDELVTNVYEHSSFSSSWVMAQKYESNGFLDISFFDNGMTIPGNFQRSGFIYPPEDSIIQAIKGKSTKSPERGYGLYSTVKIVNALDGDVLIASGAGVVYTNDKKWWKWNRKNNSLDGTLITLGVPHPPPQLSGFYGCLT